MLINTSETCSPLWEISLLGSQTLFSKQEKLGGRVAVLQVTAGTNLPPGCHVKRRVVGILYGHDLLLITLYTAFLEAPKVHKLIAFKDSRC